jgi:hypothetical protein
MFSITNSRLVNSNVCKRDRWRTDWLTRNRRGRHNKPSSILYCDGKMMVKEWFYNDRFHRIDGPAIISYDKYGAVIVEEWYRNGVYERIVWHNK